MITMRVIQFGDVARVAYNFAKILNFNGIESEFHTLSKPFAYPIFDWVKVIDRKGKFPRLRLMINLLNATRNTDLIHGHCLSNVLLPFMGKPFIAHFHGFDVRVYAKGNTMGAKLLLWAMRHSKKILVSSPYLVKEVAQLGFSENKILWIPNPIDTKIFRKVHSSLVLRERDDQTILFLPSNHTLTKGKSQFLKAFHEITRDYPELFLIMMDRGDCDPGINETRQLIHQLGLNDHVRFIPKVDPHKMPGYYNASDIIVDQFNALKALGQVALEGLACQLPVISSIPLDKDFYGAESPIFGGESKEEIVKALRYVLTHRYEWEKLGEKGREWVKKTHGEAVVMKRLLSVYQQILGRE